MVEVKRFSRRNKTNEAFLAYQTQQESRMLEQQAAFKVRVAAAKNRTPEEQIARLNTLFGEGKGAKKERKKLALRIEIKEEAKRLKTREEAKKDAQPKKKAKRQSKKGS